jgi:hypothetical protein
VGRKGLVEGGLASGMDAEHTHLETRHSRC